MTIDVTDLAEDRFALRLDKAWFVEHGFAPLYAGTSWSLRFQVLDDEGAAVDLTDATIAMSVTPRTGGSAVFARSTEDGVTIEDQETAKGWFAVASDAADETALLAAAGPLHAFDIRVKLASGAERVEFAGVLEILRPQTLSEAVNPEAP
jgi:hypothetical protein